MRKIFTTVILATLVSLGVSFTAQADTMAPTFVSPTPNSIQAPPIAGTIYIVWPENLANSTGDYGMPFKKLENPSEYVTIKVNGEAIPEIQNSYATGNVYFGQFEVSNEQNGSETTEELPAIQIQLPYDAFASDDASNYMKWKGTVSIEVKAGAVTSTTGKTSEAVNITYYVMDAITANPTYSPASGEQFESGTGSVTVSWEGETLQEINRNIDEELFPIFVKQDEKNQVNMTSYSKVQDGKLVVNLAYLPSGSYTLYFTPAALIFEGDKVNAEITNESDLYNFTIKQSTNTYPDAVISPASGESFTSVEDLENVTVTWSDTTVKLNEENEEDVVIYYNGKPLEGVEVSLNSSDSGIDIALGDALIGGGIYRVVVPTGYVLVKALETDVYQWSDEVTADYYLLVAPDAVFTPANGSQLESTEDLATITVTWPGCYFTFGDTDEEIELWFEDTQIKGFSVTTEWNRDSEGLEEYDGNVLFITTEGLEDLGYGDFSVIIPEGFVELAGLYGSVTDENDVTTMTTVPNSAVEAVYSIVEASTGITGISSELKDGRVYNLQGIKVNTAKDGLKKGLYIINGKKVMVK